MNNISSTYTQDPSLTLGHSQNQRTDAQSQTNSSSEFLSKVNQNDSVTLSTRGLEKSEQNEKKEKSDSSKEDKNLTSAQDSPKLEAEELKEVVKLQSRDAEVRAHEQAHLSAAGQYAAGGASFSYKAGPNGKRYAVGGEVPIDMSKESTPAETILKMQTVKRAALAPASPSSADRGIASQATMIEAQARTEQQAEVRTENKSQTNTSQASTVDQSAKEAANDETKNRFDSQSSSKDSLSISQNSRQLVLRAYQQHTH